MDPKGNGVAPDSSDVLGDVSEGAHSGCRREEVGRKLVQCRAGRKRAPYRMRGCERREEIGRDRWDERRK